MKKVALLTLHGMGKEDPDYYKPLAQRLESRLGAKWSEVAFFPVNYASILQGPQDTLWSDMVKEPTNRLDATRLRRFFLFGFGDAGSLENSANGDKVAYMSVQRAIHSKLKDAFLEVGSRSNCPVVIVAQSLGCHVISNYIWDAEHKENLFKGQPDDDIGKFTSLRSLASLFTTGCNIPLFVAGLSKRVCFTPPNPKFTWDNFYDEDDVLGWPLRQLGPTYEVIRDRPINAGGILSSWNVFSHSDYWEDKDFVDPVVDKLNSLLLL